MISYIKKLMNLLFFTNLSHSFLINIKPQKVIKMNSVVTNDIYNEIYYDIFNKNFFNKTIPCYSLTLPGPEDPKICKNCKHFISNNFFRVNYISNNVNISSDISGKIIDNINLNTGYCNKFTFTNKITGEEQKLFAFICRSNEKLCGSDANYYEEKDF
jgi:hypothetical protein